MELRVLRYFLAVVEEGNITGGAELLRISQPTLSRQLRQLEDDLGVTLFERGQRNVTLTPEGVLLRDRARVIVELADKTEREVAGHDLDELFGDIAVSCGELHGMDRFARCMARFRERHPHVKFSIFSATADVTQERVEQGLADVTLMNEPIDMKRFDYLRLPDLDVWGAVVRSDDELASRSSVSPSDLADRPLLMPCRSQVRVELLNWFGPQLRDRLIVAGTYNLPLNAAAAVRGGLGIGLCIDAGQCGGGVSFVPFSPSLSGSCVIAWRRGRVLAPAAAAFVEFLAQNIDERS